MMAASRSLDVSHLSDDRVHFREASKEARGAHCACECVAGEYVAEEELRGVVMLRTDAIAALAMASADATLTLVALFSLFSLPVMLKLLVFIWISSSGASIDGIGVKFAIAMFL